MPQAATPIVNRALVTQMLQWIAERPRTYGETMEAWRTSCPRLSIWEDAMESGLVVVRPVAGGGMNGSAVLVTAMGDALLQGAA